MSFPMARTEYDVKQPYIKRLIIKCAPQAPACVLSECLHSTSLQGPAPMVKLRPTVTT